MAKQRLDPALLAKMAARTRKTEQYLREQISRRANRLGVSSPAAQAVWCNELGIGSQRFLNQLPPEVRQEVRDALTGNAPAGIRATTKSATGTQVHQKTSFDIKVTVDAVLQDDELRGRCRDLLSAPRHYDRVFREATTVLDNRLKSITGIRGLKPRALVGKVLNSDPAKAVIVVSDEPEEQAGFFKICDGVMATFRNNAHHTLSDRFTQPDALKFCGLIDMILAVIAAGTLHPERTK